MSEDGGSDARFSTLVPNGIILGLIGALVLITPLTVEVSGRQLVMDLVAGGVLLVGGAGSFVLGRSRARRRSSRVARPSSP